MYCNQYAHGTYAGRQPDVGARWRFLGCAGSSVLFSSAIGGPAMPKRAPSSTGSPPNLEYAVSYASTHAMQACIRARAPFGVGVGVGTLPPSCRELIEDEYGVVWCVHGACSSAGRRCINVNNGMNDFRLQLGHHFLSLYVWPREHPADGQVPHTDDKPG